MHVTDRQGFVCSERCLLTDGILGRECLAKDDAAFRLREVVGWGGVRPDLREENIGARGAGERTANIIITRIV